MALSAAGSHFPEPARTDDLRGLLLTYLDFYRHVIERKVDGLSEASLMVSHVPSGWTPSGLVNHLAFMERRWVHWGFMGERMENPWQDSADGGWVSPSAGPAALAADLEAVGRRTREIVESHSLTDSASLRGRFAGDDEAPQLHWILLHVLQEYARHAGHLDIARELIDGSTGEEGLA